MERLAIAVALFAVAVAVAAVLRRRLEPEAPSTPAQWHVPDRLERADFTRPEAPWLVVVFSSATCDSCGLAIAKSAALASEFVAVADCEAVEQAHLHARYGIEAVPIIVVADADGDVRAAFIGTPTATDLWAAVAELREPGSSPEPHLGRVNDGQTPTPGSSPPPT